MKRASTALAAFALLLCCAFALRLRSQQEKKLTVFAPNSTYSIPVADVDGKEMIGIVDLLDPLGTVALKTDGKRQLLFFSSHGATVQAELQSRKAELFVGKQIFDLGANVVVENGRTLIPLRSAALALNSVAGAVDPAIAHSILHTQGRRLLLIENPAQLQWTQAPSLILQFSVPVHPQIQSSGETLRISFPKDAVTGLPDDDRSPDRFIRSLNYTEHNGDAELLVKAATPLSATLQHDDRELVIAPAAAPAAQSAQQATEPAAPTAVSPSTTAPAATNPNTPSSAPARTLIVINAAHGGGDTGGTLTTDLLEKDFTLQLARRLHTELLNRGFAVTMIRDSDATIAPEQRAATADAARPDLYIELHAVTQAAPIRIYTAAMHVSDDSHQLFIPFSSAQQPWLPLSTKVANTVVASLVAAENGDENARAESRSARIPVLPSIAAPAVAIEIAPESANIVLNSPQYQQRIARKLADALVAAKLALAQQERTQ